MPPVLPIVEDLGIFVFALSGALAAARKDMDIFGFAVLALMPAVGGGTIRDLVLDLPVFWVENSRPIVIALAAALLAWFAERHVASRQRLIVWADALGLALFAAVGAEKAWTATGDHLIAVMMGVTTGVAGGMIRDIIANEVPLILQQDIYATAAVVAALAFVAAASVGLAAPWPLLIGVALGFAVRASAIAWNWSLPRRRR